MATYKGIQGYSVQKLASDPAASAATEGQVWYNTASAVLKGYNGTSNVTFTAT